MPALSQLSYGPLVISQSSREVEVVGPSDASQLIVFSRVEPEADLDRGEPLDRKKEAAIELVTIRSEGVDLVGSVETSNQPLLGAAIRIAANNNDIAVPGRPLALHAAQFRAEVENQVVPLVPDGAENANAEFDCRQCDRCLGNRSFLIRCHFRQRSRRIGWAVS
jgi:hypothetical protein